MIKNILFDFDGVILDSMPIRDFGFREIFKSFDTILVDKLIEYHNLNGGLSRYVKIRYFYEEILKKTILEKTVNEYAEKFSIIMKRELIKREYLIKETCTFIEQNFDKFDFHIVSGSDEKELQYLCKELGLSKYFLSINGSPTPKNDLVKNLIIENKYLQNETILIGDSINDFEAAKNNNLDFYGFNNDELKKQSKTYISSFENFYFFDYGVGEISHSSENKTFYNIKKNITIDYLVFFDSRGLSVDNDNCNETILCKLKEVFEKNNKTYIIVSRPKNLTIFASLLNFLSLNHDLKFKKLITNLGFVDLTPKKDILIDDMLSQISLLSKLEVEKNALSTYTLSNGNEEKLYSLKYLSEYIDFISSKLSSSILEKALLLNTPIISKNIKIDRNRPHEFFEKLFDTNKFINKLLNKNFVIADNSDIFKENELRYTFDAVHYTIKGHSEIFKRINDTNFL